jgi:hypothetical protein
LKGIHPRKDGSVAFKSYPQAEGNLQVHRAAVFVFYLPESKYQDRYTDLCLFQTSSFCYISWNIKRSEDIF